jgi:hypothetical protein
MRSRNVPGFAKLAGKECHQGSKEEENTYGRHTSRCSGCIRSGGGIHSPDYKPQCESSTRKTRWSQ